MWQRGGRFNQDGFVVKLRLRVTLTPDLSNVRSLPPYGDDATVKISGFGVSSVILEDIQYYLKQFLQYFFIVVSKQFAFQ